ncbi:MAG: MATE family efflux transporter [Eubacteriales bacterium]|nr:MATE family efflux transporter [Eubacteriales bacterium]
MKQEIQLSSHFTYKRLINFTLPCIGMMIFTSIYSVVDGFFVSNYAGKTAFAAVNLIFPVLIIMVTVGFMLGTGGSAIVAKAFGEGDEERANSNFSLFVYTGLIIGVVIAVLGYIFIRPIAIALKAEGELLENAVLYGRIILVSLPFNILQYLFQPFFVTAEKPKLALWSTVCAGVINIVLDAVLVILLPLEYKLAGAATATAVSQIIGGIIPLVYFGRKNTSILRLGKTNFDGRALMQACINGSSEFMSNIAMNVVGILYNVQLLKYAGENGVAAYGVMMYVSLIFSGAFIGYSIGTAPIFGYNDGARNYTELKNLLKKSLILIGIFSFVMTVLAEVMTVPLSKFFVGYDAELMSLTVSGFRIYSIAFLFMGYAIFASSFFTALNDGVTSAIISFLRTLVFQVGSVLLLPVILGINGIWYSDVVAEFMAVIFSAIFMFTKRKKYHY